MKIPLVKYLAVLLLVAHFSTGIQAQPSPPVVHGSTEDEPAGGGAPIGDGLLILGALGLAYAGRKMYIDWKKITD
jgi:hypothetical protein